MPKSIFLTFDQKVALLKKLPTQSIQDIAAALRVRPSAIYLFCVRHNIPFQNNPPQVVKIEEDLERRRREKKVPKNEYQRPPAVYTNLNPHRYKEFE